MCAWGVRQEACFLTWFHSIRLGCSCKRCKSPTCFGQHLVHLISKSTFSQQWLLLFRYGASVSQSWGKGDKGAASSGTALTCGDLIMAWFQL